MSDTTIWQLMAFILGGLFVYYFDKYQNLKRNTLYKPLYPLQRNQSGGTNYTSNKIKYYPVTPRVNQSGGTS